MRIQFNKDNYESTANRQILAVINNTRYSFDHFMEFHRTVLSLLDSGDLSHLSSTQKKNAEFFYNIVVNLLDPPKIFKGTQPQYKKSSKQKPSSSQDLQKLLIWIDRWFRYFITRPTKTRIAARQLVGGVLTSLKIRSEDQQFEELFY